MRILSRSKKILLGIILFFVIFTIAGFFIFPPILKSILIKTLSESLKREVLIREVKVNPYTLSATVKGITVKERQEISKEHPFFAVEEFFVNFESFSVLRMAIVIKEFRIRKPHIWITRRSDLTFNFSDLLLAKEEMQTKQKKKEYPLFSLNNIRIEDGSIDFWDEAKGIRHTIRDLKVGIPFISNIPSQVETFVQPYFYANINGTPYELKGQTKPFHDSKETDVEIRVSELNIPQYASYAPIKMNFKVLSAFLDASLRIRFIQSGNKAPNLSINGDVFLKKLAVNDLDNKSILRIPHLQVTLSSFEPFTKNVHISQVVIQSPEMNVSREKDGSVNVIKILPIKKEDQKDTQALTVKIDEIQLTNGKFHFSDFSRGRPFKTTFYPVEFKVEHFTNKKGENSHYALMAKTESKEEISVSGELSLDPLRVYGNLAVKSISIRKYAPYYQDIIFCDIERGLLNLSAEYLYSMQGEKPEISLTKANLDVKEMHIKTEGKADDLLKVSGLSVSETDVYLTKQEIRIGRIQTERGKLRVVRRKDGSINLLQVIGQTGLPQKEFKGKEQKKPEKGWLISLKEVTIEQYQVEVADLSLKAPANLTIDDIRLKGEGISTVKNAKGKVSLSLLLNKKGRIKVSGAIGLEPLEAILKVDLKEIPFSAFQPYIAERLRIQVMKGSLSTTGDLLFSLSDEKEAKASFKGDITMRQFASAEKRTGEDILKWDSLDLEGFQFDLVPFRLNVKRISLTDFYARIQLYPEGKLNLQEILVEESGQKGAAQHEKSPVKEEEIKEVKKAPQRQVQIGALMIQGGRVDFYDRTLDPHYFTRMVDINGKILGLSSEESALADLELRGKLDGYAPLEIVGKVNPLKEDLFVDIKVRFKDMDLTSMTPYSGKYVGYTIEKGKLSLDLEYLIEKRKLDSENRIFLDQFTFGEKVESPHATRLPVKLAIALLKDRNGLIRLDIPVRGTLDDPKFSLWRIILQVIVNLITKAVTSPFALLGAIVGGGEEISYVEFEEGTTALNEVNLKKIEDLAKVIEERPEVKLEIEGHVDLEKDKDGLKREIFLKKLKAQKLKEMVRKGQAPASLDEITIEPKEYSKYLRRAYKQEKFPKPKNLLGMVKDLPDSEIEKLMFSHIEVKESDLRMLALMRAQKVKEIILKSRPIEPERIFFVEPKHLAPERKQNVKDSRVEFRIK